MCITRKWEYIAVSEKKVRLLQNSPGEAEVKLLEYLFLIHMTSSERLKIYGVM